MSAADNSEPTVLVCPFVTVHTEANNSQWANITMRAKPTFAAGSEPSDEQLDKASLFMSKFADRWKKRVRRRVDTVDGSKTFYGQDGQPVDFERLIRDAASTTATILAKSVADSLTNEGMYQEWGISDWDETACWLHPATDDSGELAQPQDFSTHFQAMWRDRSYRSAVGTSSIWTLRRLIWLVCR